MFARIGFVVLLSTASVAAALGPQASPSSAAGPAARRAEQVIAVMNDGTRAAAKSFVDAHVVPERREALLRWLSGVQDATRGLESAVVEDAQPYDTRIRTRSVVSGRWLNLRVRTEPQEPFRVEALTVQQEQWPAPAAAGSVAPSEMARRLDELMTRLVAADIFSGAVLFAKDGEVIFAKAGGVANKDFGSPNTLDTRFNLGSMNKMFTSVAIAQLVERGRLSFDDPLSKFLPDFPDAASASKIRIKHLLTHTSGLGSYFNDTFFESSRDRFRTVNDMMALAKGETLQFEPGSRWEYSNTGMLVLGAVIEKVTGQDYFDYMREHIYAPAGMTRSDSYELDLVNPNLAVGYEKEYTDDGIRFRNNLYAHVIRGGPAGGGYSTVGDLLKFDRALRSNKLVGAPYVALLLSPKPELSSPDYGYGFFTFTANGVTGHSGGFFGIHSNLDMFMDSGYTAVVMSNYGTGAMSFVTLMRELAAAGTR